MGKTLSTAVFFLTAVIIVLPSLIARGCNMPAGALTLPRQSSPQADLNTEVNVRLFRNDLGEVVTMPLDEYLTGVVAAEMPASFAPEALKAQAVVARTYAVRRLRRLAARAATVIPEPTSALILPIVRPGNRKKNPLPNGRPPRHKIT